MANPNASGAQGTRRIRFLRQLGIGFRTKWLKSKAAQKGRQAAFQGAADTAAEAGWPAPGWAPQPRPAPRPSAAAPPFAWYMGMSSDRPRPTIALFGADVRGGSLQASLQAGALREESRRAAEQEERRGRTKSSLGCGRMARHALLRRCSNLPPHQPLSRIMPHHVIGSSLALRGRCWDM